MRVTLYSKPGCTLCDDLKADLRAMQPEFNFDLVEFNIEQDAGAFERYRYVIPVLDIEGGALIYPPHTAHELHQALFEARQRMNEDQSLV
jgi:glutaredoxin